MAKYVDDLDAVATALAHAGRRQVVARLSSGPATSSELARMLEIALPSVQRHLGVLAEAELITSCKTGRVVTHRLRTEPLERFDTWLATRTSFWTHQLDCLADSLSEQEQS